MNVLSITYVPALLTNWSSVCQVRIEPIHFPSELIIPFS